MVMTRGLSCACPWPRYCAEEDVADLARHVEGGEQRAEDEQVERVLGRRSNRGRSARMASLLQKPEKKSGKPQSASMPTA